MKITFIGALHEVTGSCTLLEVNGKNYLVDCGMEQGRDIFENVPIPVSMGEIEGVFLTHAHIDHSGWIPPTFRNQKRSGKTANPGGQAKTLLNRSIQRKMRRERSLCFGVSPTMNGKPSTMGWMSALWMPGTCWALPALSSG